MKRFLLICLAWALLATPALAADLTAGSLTITGSVCEAPNLDTGVNVVRTLSGPGGSGHAFTDLTVWSRYREDPPGYASVSCTPRFIGENAMDHIVGFQWAPDYQSTGELWDIYGVFLAPWLRGGPVGNYYGVYAQDPAGNNNIYDTFAFYAAGNWDSGTHKNWAFYSEGGGVELSSMVRITYDQIVFTNRTDGSFMAQFIPADGFTLYHAGQRTLASIAPGAVTVGIHDQLFGQFALFGGPAGQPQGGTLYFYPSADYANPNTYMLYTYGDRLRLGYSSRTDAIVLDGANDRVQINAAFAPPKVTDEGMDETPGQEGDECYNRADRRKYLCVQTGNPAVWVPTSPEVQ